MSGYKLPELPNGYWWELASESDQRAAYLMLKGPILKGVSGVVAAVPVTFRGTSMSEIAVEIAAEAESLKRRREVYLDAAKLLELEDSQYS